MSVSRYDPSILQQIAINRARTPTQRFLALCELLEAQRAMAPKDEAARQRSLKVQALRQREREHSHAQWRKLFGAQRARAAEGV
jgi:hypothetical protein